MAPETTEFPLFFVVVLDAASHVWQAVIIPAGLQAEQTDE